MNLATQILIATRALKLKRAEFRETTDGLEIRQRGQPRLLLTWDAISEFAEQVAEAEQ